MRSLQMRSYFGVGGTLLWDCITKLEQNQMQPSTIPASLACGISCLSSMKFYVHRNEGVGNEDSAPPSCSHNSWVLISSLLLKCCFTSTETVGLLGTGAQDGHLDFHTAPELWLISSTQRTIKYSEYVMHMISFVFKKAQKYAAQKNPNRPVMDDQSILIWPEDLKAATL